jgi:type II secretory pathway predicted ATPase ExeA
MITTFYSLSDTPFAKDILPEELLTTDAFTELNRRLDYMRQRCGLMLLTGEAGTGKTVAVRAFVQTLNPSIYRVVYVPLSTVTPLDFYTQLNTEFGGRHSVRKSTLFKNLQHAVRDYVNNSKKTPILVLDEAQSLPDRTLDEIPIILNFKMDSVDPLLMIMIGHPDLARRLARPMFRNLHQRILLNYHIPPLSEDDTRRYVIHHLQRVGAKNPIFSDSAYLALYKTSAGLCRLINRLALAALNRGAFLQKPSLTEEDIFEASQEI